MFYTICLTILFIATIPTFIYLYFFTAPYGRHYRDGFGPTFSNRWGWVIMECPSVFFFIFIYSLGINAAEWVPLSLLMIWQFHYVYRCFIFPFLLKTQGKKMPILIILSGFIFNTFNAYLNAYWIANIGHYPLTWFISTKFIVGILIFFIGFFIHFRSDTILINLRKSTETGYKIPQGFLFHWIGSPNYFGEIIAWIGFTIASWSLAALAFTLFTIANLLPRAIKHLQWYQKNFKDFPKNKRALIPFII